MRAGAFSELEEEALERRALRRQRGDPETGLDELSRQGYRDGFVSGENDVAAVPVLLTVRSL